MSRLRVSSRCGAVMAWTAALFLAGACGTGRKLSGLYSGEVAAAVSIPSSSSYDTTAIAAGMKLVESQEGNESVVMNAVLDEESGEMVASDRIVASVVSAKFRNVAERHGKVDLEFLIRVPASMQDSRWQLRFHPDMFMLGDSIRLEDVLITGAGYRAAQLRGYEHYRRFLSRIVDDPEYFIDVRDLEIFIERNIPELYAFRNDTSFVSYEDFSSSFGVTGRQAVEHYTDRLALWLNERRRARSPKVMRRLVKVPIVTEGIRLDTVMRSSDGDFIYSYRQTINTRPALKRVDIVMSGEIYDSDRRIYTMPAAAPLTYYISSLSSLADLSERYRTIVVSRNVESEASYRIDFRQGDAAVDSTLGRNAAVLSQMAALLRSLGSETELVLDSVIVRASASPEGSVPANGRLAARRAASVAAFFRDGMPEMTDISFGFSSAGENWKMLDSLVQSDTSLTSAQKEDYRALSGLRDQDASEARLSTRAYYPYLRGRLYPQLRTVVLNCHMHRAGMLSDTVHTSELDTCYMRGVNLLKDRDYAAAADLLSPYEDINTALAYLALDRNRSALIILSRLPESAAVDYLLALANSRVGEEKAAVEMYLRSCSMDQSFVHRGNLDPEISALIKKYKLNEL